MNKYFTKYETGFHYISCLYFPIILSGNPEVKLHFLFKNIILLNKVGSSLFLRWLIKIIYWLIKIIY